MVPSSLVQPVFGALAHILAETLAQISDLPSPVPRPWALATTVQYSIVSPNLILSFMHRPCACHPQGTYSQVRNRQIKESFNLK